MTRKLSLTSAVAVTALVFAAPAFGIIPRSDGSGGSEGLHPAIAAQLARQSAPLISPDAFERVVAARQSSPPAGALTVPDAFERAVANAGEASVPAVSATSTGSEIEWPQVGVGLGIGLLLALGLGLVMRVVRIRPVAH